MNHKVEVYPKFILIRIEKVKYLKDL